MKEETEDELKATEEDKEETKEREVIIPGEVIISGDEYLPGDWTRREGKDIIASRFGLAEKSGRLIRVIPLSGIYTPRIGNVVIGTVTDVTFNGWIIDINAPYLAFLPLMESPRFVSKENLQDFLDIGEILVAKVDSMKHRGVDLTIRAKGLGRQENGMIIHINPNKVPRVIGREGSMINLIKNETKCDIIVGQNGLIWIKGDKVEDELKAKEAILLITKKANVSGLTEQMEKWFRKGDDEE